MTNRKNRSGEVATWRIGEEKPPVPPPPVARWSKPTPAGKPVKQPRRVDPYDVYPPAPVSEAEGLEMIRQHYRFYTRRD